MNKLFRALGLFFIAICFFQCQKEIGHIGGPDTIITPQIVEPDPITAHLQGNVVDENNQPASGVAVTVGSKTTTTDASGYFRIDRSNLDKNTSMVTVEKAGYFKGYRVFAATSGTNQVFIKLIKKSLAGTVAASSGGDATLSNGTKVSLPANGIVNATSGTDYTGDVRVYAAYIDPSANDISQTVPGSFLADDKNGQRVVMTSYGMVAVQLETPSGEKLQIKTGQAAKLTTPIPSAAIASAPATIALWSVDEQTGIWKEEGTATKTGNNYVGDVSHFSFWNCDVAQNAVKISMTLHTADSLPIVHAIVKITRAGTGWQFASYGSTDSLGQVSGFVPSNEALVVQVIDPCGSVVYTQNVGPLTQNTELGIITPGTNTSGLITIKGTLLKCTGQPVTNGYAVISLGFMVRMAATDSLGNYATSFITCSSTPSTATVIGIDNSSNQQSSASTVTLTLPLTNAGSLTACGTSSAQYINYTLNGTNYSITSATNDSINAFYINQGATFHYVAVMGNQIPNGHNISFNAKGATGIGTYPVENLNVQNLRQTVLMQPFEVTFTSYANNPGEFFEGSFSGSFSSGLPTVVHTISCNFRVRRNN